AWRGSRAPGPPDNRDASAPSAQAAQARAASAGVRPPAASGCPVLQQQPAKEPALARSSGFGSSTSFAPAQGYVLVFDRVNKPHPAGSKNSPAIIKSRIGQ